MSLSAHPNPLIAFEDVPELKMCSVTGTVDIFRALHSDCSDIRSSMKTRQLNLAHLVSKGSRKMLKTVKI